MNRNTIGQFKTKARKWPLYLALVSGAIILGGQATDHYGFIADIIKPVELHYMKAEAAELPPTPDTIEKMKGDVLDTLAKCESGGKKSEEGIDTIDTNNKVSYGRYQFQKATVQYYHKRLYAKEISGKDAILLALDDERARELAGAVIFGTENGLDNWINCTAWHDLDTLVTLIKKYE